MSRFRFRFVPRSTLARMSRSHFARKRTSCSSSLTMPRRLRRRRTKRVRWGWSAGSFGMPRKARPPNLDESSSRSSAECQSQSTLFSEVEKQPSPCAVTDEEAVIQSSRSRPRSSWSDRDCGTG